MPMGDLPILVEQYECGDATDFVFLTDRRVQGVPSIDPRGVVGCRPFQ